MSSFTPFVTPIDTTKRTVTLNLTNDELAVIVSTLASKFGPAGFPAGGWSAANGGVCCYCDGLTTGFLPLDEWIETRLPGLKDQIIENHTVRPLL